MPVLVIHATRRRFVDEPSDEEGWQILHRIADRAYLPLRLAALTALNTMRQALTGLHRRLVQALALDRGNGLVSDPVLAQAVQAGTLVLQAQGTPLVTETVTRAAVALVPETASTLGLTIVWNQANPLVGQAIDAQVGLLIRGISDESLRAVRGIMRQSFQEGLGIPQIARRLEQTIGLRDAQAQTLRALRQRLEAQGMKAGRVQQQVDLATRRALRHRATVISRTESLRASNLGAHLLLQEVEQQGLIDHAMRRVFIVTPDDRICSICNTVPSLNINGVGLRTPFTTSIGPIMYPPVHPSCRCTVALKRFNN